MSEPLRNRIVLTLSAESSPLRDEGIALAVDHVLAERLRDVIDLASARDIVVSAITEENVSRILMRHVRPGFDRFTDYVSDSQTTVGALVPDPSRIRAIVAKSPLPRAKWADGMVDPVLMRRLFAPVWANLLTSFAKRLPIPGLGGSTGATASGAARGVSGIAERLTRGVQERAEKIVDASRSVMGGLGAEVERRMQAAARDFSESAADLFREALRDRMKSREGTEIIGQVTAQVIDHVMKTAVAAVHEDVKPMPVTDILSLVGGIVAHSVAHPFVKELIDVELQTFLDIEGDRTLRDLLTELGVLDRTRAEVVQSAAVMARGLFSTPEFADWLGRLLDA